MSVLAFQHSADAVACEDRIALNMAQLAPTGLSEQWLLRDCGDRHWALIARALGQDQAVFRAPDGRAVYAAFCATALDLTLPERALLGQTLHIRSELSLVSGTRIGSVHHLSSASGPLGQLRMISAFVSHDADGSNRRLMRNPPAGVMRLPCAPESLLAMDAQARQTRQDLRHWRPEGPPLGSATPVPALDFNAVGLLYFPSFSRIAEQIRPAASPLRRRDVTYLGNIDQGETILAHDRGDALVLTRDDTTPLALIRTV